MSTEIRFGHEHRENKQPGSGGKMGAGCMILFALPFFVMGCAAAVAGIQKIIKTSDKEGYILAGMGSLFAFVGMGIGVAAIFGYKKSQVAEAKKQENPDEPWKWNSDWANGEIKSSGKTVLWVIWFFAIIWNVISWGATIAAYSEYAKGKKEVLFVLIFPIIGIGVLAWAIYATLQHKKYGVSVFRMLSVPGVLGGTIRGAIEIPVQVDPEKGFKVRLACIKRVTSGSGKNRSTSEHIQWEDEKIIVKDLLESDRSRTGIPVFFNIPYDLPEPVSGNPAILWKIFASAETVGVDYAAEFEIPVYRTKDSDPESKTIEDPTATYQPDPADYRPPSVKGLRFRESVHGDVELYFPPASSIGGILGSGVFFAIWTGAIWLMVTQKAPIFFPIVFGLFDIIIGLIFLSTLFYSVRVKAGPLGLEIYHRFLFPTTTRRLSRSEVKQIAPHMSGQTNNKAHYNLEVYTVGGQKYTASSSIRDKRHAEWLAARLMAALDKK